MRLPFQITLASVCVLGMVSARPVPGQVAELLCDVNTRPQPLRPIRAVTLGDLVVFPARDPAYGVELWSIRVGASKATLVKDVAPGAADSFPQQFATLGNILLFTAKGPDGWALWRSDGTAEGTWSISATAPVHTDDENGELKSASTDKAVVGKRMFYRGISVQLGEELWVTDGTASGTRLVKDIIPGQPSSSPQFLAAVGDRVAFAAGSAPSVGGGNDIEFWLSDGSEAGTYEVDNINPSNHSVPRYFVRRQDGRIFFAANTAAQGSEVWYSDAPYSSASLLRDLSPNTGAEFYPVDLTLQGNRLFYVQQIGANYCLVTSDGTAAGTTSIHTFGAVTSDPPPSIVGAADGSVLVSAREGANARLFVSDGTSAGTFILSPEGTTSEGMTAEDVARVGDRWVMSLDGPLGAELWASDGSVEGTQLLLDINPGSAPSSPRLFHSLGKKAVFFVTSSLGDSELWESDGTLKATRKLAALTSSATQGSSPKGFETGIGGFYFSANASGAGRTMVFYNATTRQAVSVLPNQGCDQDPTGILLGSQFIFSHCYDDNGAELWVTEGSSSSTGLLKDVAPGSPSGSPANFAVLGSSVLFRANDGGSARTELWRSDGTTDGTSMVRDISPGLVSSNPGEFRIIDGVALFQATTSAEGTELWRSDGTSEGTFLVKDIKPGSSGSSPRSLTILENRLYFVADDGENGPEVWASDGTSGGTVPVTADAGGPFTAPRDLAVLDGQLYFIGGPSASDSALWRTDGTVAGTEQVVTVGSALYLTSAGGRLYFASYTEDEGMELWTSDGTEAGTSLVRDINPGAASSNPSSLTAFQNRLYFVANDGVTGAELWVSDGTSAGTRRLTDLTPGPVGSNLKSLKVISDMLLFCGTDPTHGEEVWAIRAGGPAKPKAPTHLKLIE